MHKLLPCLFLVFGLQTFAQQCAVCLIDLTCDSVPAAPKLCPAALPTDTAGQYYNADLTFYIPKEFQDAQYGTVNLNQIDVLGVTGLPAGMSWTAYNYLGQATNSFFPPASPPSSERGCAKICGTPPMPFDDSITVSVLAYVTVSGVNATQNTSFKVHLKIVPNPSGNSVFSMDNSQACDSITVNFTPNLASNGSSMITYDWNFGNGNTSTAENVSQTYSTAGDYTVKCTTMVYQYVITDVSLSSLNNNWCGDVEEWSCTFNNPDPFFQVNNNGGITTSDTVLDKKSNISYPSLNIPLEGNQFIIYVFDADNGPPFGSATDSLGYKTITVSGNGGTYSFTTGSPFAGTNGVITIAKQIKDTYIDSDLVHVYSPPVLNPITSTPNDTVCGGETATLSTNSGFGNYQWYLDTILLNGQNANTLSVQQSGTYWVRVSNAYGCYKNSNSQSVTVLPLPLASVSASGPTTFCEGSSLTLTAINSSSYSWSNGASTQSITVSAAGEYRVVVSNANGCSDTSVTIPVSVMPSPASAITASGPTQFCQGDSVVLSTDSADMYIWSNGESVQQISVGSSGSYSVTTFFNNGCKSVSSPIIIAAYDLPQPEITLSGTTAFCQGDSAMLNVTIGNSYLWSNGANTQSIIINAAGNYAVTVTDANGCSGETDTTVIDPGGPLASASSSPSSQGVCDGTATATANGGQAPYTFLWSVGGQTTQTATGLCAGTYSVTVTDANQCSDIVSVQISESSLVNEKAVNNFVTIFPNPSSGNFTVTINGISYGQVQFTLYNILGEVILISAPVQISGNYSETVYADNFKKGIYFIRVEAGEQIEIKKIILQ